MNKKITIAMVCFNAEATIDTTIQSVLCQTYNNFEFVIVDGNSKDKTLDIIKKYPSIKYISEPDKGVYDAMNKALKIAEGDYLLFLGADDILYSPDVLKLVSNYLIDDSIYYGNVIKTNREVVYDGEFSIWKWGYKNICHQSIFYPKSIYKNKYYDIKYKLVADWVYNLQLLAKGSKFYYINVIISYYNDVSGISSTQIDECFLKERKQLIVNAVGILPYYYGLLCKTLNKFL